jgi:hypothetical protein
MKILDNIKGCFVINLFPWIIMIIITELWYIRAARNTEDWSWISRGGGMLSFIGLLITTVASVRVDQGISKRFSEDIFYKWGFIITAMGTVIWAIGDEIPETYKIITEAIHKIV